MTKVYVSHPIAGTVDKGLAMADEMEREISYRGGEAVKPLDLVPSPHDGPCHAANAPQGNNEHSAACHMKADLLALLDCDVLLAAPGCWNSTGCKAEMMLAGVCGIPVYFYLPSSGPNCIVDAEGKPVSTEWADRPEVSFDDVKGCAATTFVQAFDDGDAVEEVYCDLPLSHDRILHEPTGKTYDHRNEKHGVAWNEVPR